MMFISLSSNFVVSQNLVSHGVIAAHVVSWTATNILTSQSKLLVNDTICQSELGEGVGCSRFFYVIHILKLPLFFNKMTIDNNEASRIAIF